MTPTQRWAAVDEEGLGGIAATDLITNGGKDELLLQLVENLLRGDHLLAVPRVLSISSICSINRSS
jgi:hypothetical protein